MNRQEWEAELKKIYKKSIFHYPKFLNDYPNLQFMTANTVLVDGIVYNAKTRRGTEKDFKQLLDTYNGVIYLHSISKYRYIDPDTYTHKTGTTFKYAEVPNK